MPKQILLVDDSVTIHRMVEITFAQDDFALTTVKSADEGVAKAKSLKPDLVLVDATLPGKSGYDVIAAIRADSALGQTACLLLTGNFSPYDEAKGGSAGVDGFVVKPFDSQVMIDKAKDAISRRASGITTTQPVAALPKAPAAATVLSPPPNLAAAAPRGVETLGKPLSTVAAETSQRISTQPPLAAPPPAVERPATLTPPPPTLTPPPPTLTPPPPTLTPPAGTLTPPPAMRSAPKATLMGIPAVNPASIGLGPTPAATTPPLAAKATVLSPPPKPAAPIAVEPPRPVAPAAAHSMPRIVPTMPRPSLVPGVATPSARVAEAPKPAVSVDAPKPAAEPQQDISPATREVAQKVVAAIPAAIAAKGPEYEAIAKLSREVIEQIVWEIVPELAETIIRSELDRLVRERQNA